MTVTDEQAYREEDDQRGHGGLRAALDESRKVCLEEQDRDAEDDERQRVS